MYLGDFRTKSHGFLNMRGQNPQHYVRLSIRLSSTVNSLGKLKYLDKKGFKMSSALIALLFKRKH
jgi:hypothetical protein